MPLLRKPVYKQLVEFFSTTACFPPCGEKKSRANTSTAPPRPIVTRKPSPGTSSTLTTTTPTLHSLTLS